jgi:phenylalanyl-tRNA synthetase alpha chain
MLLVVIKVSSIEDTTQKELREVEISGTLSAGEKSLADLRKRKLAVQKFERFSSLFELSRLTFM